jgi:hypothetical protein
VEKKDEHLVFLVEDIDHIVCNNVFECLVLTIYGNSLISSTSLSKFVVFSYLHVVVIDTMGTTIIIISINGGLIKTHATFTKKVCFLRLENLYVTSKTNSDKGDSNWTIELSTSIKVTTIPTFDPLVKLHFLPKDTIRNFSHHMF